MIFLGSFVNMAAIAVGCVLGMLIGKLIPKAMSDAITKGVALCVLYIGITGLIDGGSPLVTILSMVLGVVVGELLHLDDRIHRLGDRIEGKFAAKGYHGSISEGFVSSSILFCVGAMAIVGSLNSGLHNDHTTLFAKSILDGVTSVVYGSTMGIGVALSGLAVLLYQGIITLCASFAAPYLTETVIASMRCVGSLLIMAIGLNMLGLTKIRVMNYIPAVFFPILLCLVIT